MTENRTRRNIVHPLEKKFADCITYIFHPLIIPTYGMCLLWRIFSKIYFISDLRIPLLLVGITFVSTCLLPGISVFLFLRLGLVKTREMSDRKDRLLPYLITVAYYLFAYSLLKNFPVPSGMLHAIRIFILGGAASILVAAMVNLFWKISAHLIAMGGLAGALLGLAMTLGVPSLDFFYLSILVSGFVGYARLKLDAHTPSQVYTGFLLGFGGLSLLLDVF